MKMEESFSSIAHQPESSTAPYGRSARAALIIAPAATATAAAVALYSALSLRLNLLSLLSTSFDEDI